MEFKSFIEEFKDEESHLGENIKEASQHSFALLKSLLNFDLGNSQESKFMQGHAIKDAFQALKGPMEELIHNDLTVKEIDWFEESYHSESQLDSYIPAIITDQKQSRYKVEDVFKLFQRDLEPEMARELKQIFEQCEIYESMVGMIMNIIEESKQKYATATNILQYANTILSQSDENNKEDMLNGIFSFKEYLQGKVDSYKLLQQRFSDTVSNLEQTLQQDAMSILKDAEITKEKGKIFEEEKIQKKGLFSNIRNIFKRKKQEEPGLIIKNPHYYDLKPFLPEQVDLSDKSNRIYTKKNFSKIGDGYLYQGERDKKTQLMDGEGVLVNLQTQSVYQGQFKDHQYHGEGRKIFSSGTLYQGGWKNSMYSGKGTRVQPNDEIFQGVWENGKPNGVGVRIWNRGLFSQEGEFVGNTINGVGMLMVNQTELYFNILEKFYKQEYVEKKQQLFQLLQSNSYVQSVLNSNIISMVGVWQDNFMEGRFFVLYQHGYILGFEYKHGKLFEISLMPNEKEFTNGDILWTEKFAYLEQTKSRSIQVCYFDEITVQIMIKPIFKFFETLPILKRKISDPPDFNDKRMLQPQINSLLLKLFLKQSKRRDFMQQIARIDAASFESRH